MILFSLRIFIQERFIHSWMLTFHIIPPVILSSTFQGLLLSSLFTALSLSDACFRFDFFIRKFSVVWQSVRFSRWIIYCLNALQYLIFCFQLFSFFRVSLSPFVFSLTLTILVISPTFCSTNFFYAQCEPQLFQKNKSIFFSLLNWNYIGVVINISSLGTLSGLSYVLSLLGPKFYKKNFTF